MAHRLNPVGSERYISSDAFYNSETEKTKLNWFLFEYALEYDTHIYEDKRLHARLERKGVDDSAIAEFCIQYAKKMSGQILDRVSGKIESIEFGYRSIEAFFPHVGDELINSLLTAAAKAWDSLTCKCVVCPTRCISERDRKATMFDEPFYRT